MWKKKSLVNRITLAIVFVPRRDFADNLVNKANENVNVKTADLAPPYIEYYKFKGSGGGIDCRCGKSKNSHSSNSKVVDCKVGVRSATEKK